MPQLWHDSDRVAPPAYISIDSRWYRFKRDGQRLKHIATMEIEVGFGFVPTFPSEATILRSAAMQLRPPRAPALAIVGLATS